MTTWLIRRLIQALFVLLAMSVIVFIGVHVIGNPVDILISPEADQAERARVIAALGSRSAAMEAVSAVPRRRAAWRSWPQLRFQRARAAADRATYAGDDGTRGHCGADVDVLGIPLGLYAGLYPEGAAGTHDHGRQHPGVLAADFLGRPDADHGVRGAAWLAAEHGPRCDRGIVRHPVVIPDAGRTAAPGAAGVEPVAVQYFAGAATDAGRRARDAADGFRQVRARQGADAGAGDLRACAEEHHDPGGDGDRSGAWAPPSPSPS